MRARLVGFLWLICIVTGIFALVTFYAVLARGDAVTTGRNLLANEGRFRLAIAADVVSAATYLGVTALLYHLLKPAGRALSFTAATFGACGVAISGLALASQIAALALARGVGLTAFSTDQLQALAFFALRVRMQVFDVTLVFFGAQCVLLGVAIARSALLPRLIGVLLGLGGASYIVIAFVTFVTPAIGGRLAPFMLPIALIGEGTITAWLLVKGTKPRA